MSKIETLTRKFERTTNIRKNTQASRDWFKKNIKSLGSISRTELLKDPALKKRSRPGIGQMYHFFYDPKYRDSLPFYDAFPLIIMVGPAKGGFYGINLHYLPPAIRARFFDSLLEIANNKRYDTTTKFKISYELLKSVNKFKEFKPCFKRYLYNHVQSSVTLVPAEHWELALFLDTQQFRKQNARTVWANSRKSI